MIRCARGFDQDVGLAWLGRAVALALALASLACDGGDVDASAELQVGDMDPNAPEGWPLAIGDPETVPWLMPGGVRDGFEYWERNCCINWVDGAPYTATWRTGVKDGQSWDFYEGHVPSVSKAFPKVSALESARLGLADFEHSMNSVKENDPEGLADPEFQDFIGKYRSWAQERIERAKREGKL